MSAVYTCDEKGNIMAHLAFKLPNGYLAIVSFYQKDKTSVADAEGAQSWVATMQNGCRPKPVGPGVTLHR